MHPSEAEEVEWPPFDTASDDDERPVRVATVTVALRGEWERDASWSDVSEEDAPLVGWLGRAARGGPRHVSDGPAIMDALEEAAEEESAAEAESAESAEEEEESA